MKNIVTLPQKYRLEEYILCLLKGYSFGLQRIRDFSPKIQVFAHTVMVFKKVMLAAVKAGITLYTILISDNPTSRPSNNHK